MSKNNNTSDNMRDVDFQVDTINNKTKWAAYYSSSKNSITSNYVKDASESYNNYNQSMEAITHEQKHRDNYLAGMHAYPVSSEQAYKLKMHDEISANMAELITLRYKYIATGDISVFDEEPKFNFYKEAIKKGEINPQSEYKEDFDKDMSLIVNGTQKMWVEEYGNEYYIEQNLGSALANYDKTGAYVKYYDQNYENAKKIAYKIGGVDFTKYMEKDVEIPEKGKKALNEAIDTGTATPKNKYQKFLAKSCDFFGLENDDKDMVIEMAQGEYGKLGKIGAPIAATLSASIYGTFNRMKKGWLKKHPPKKNKQINKINKKKPKYRKWKNEDGWRVSEVQYWEILDMNKDIIKKPTKSHADKKKTTKKQMKKDGQNAAIAIKNLEKATEQNTKQTGNKNKQQMINMIQNMNKINGPKKSIDANKTVDILCQKYGEDAYKMLLKAIQEPSNYAKMVGDKSITTSRAAVQHLCNMSSNVTPSNKVNNLSQKER